MQEQKISLETNKLAKEKGFHIQICKCGGFPECICNNLLPTQSLLQKWLRDTHNLHIVVKIGYSDTTWYTFHIQTIEDNSYIEESENAFSNYEDTLEAALQEALKLIKTK